MGFWLSGNNQTKLRGVGFTKGIDACGFHAFDDFTVVF